MPASLLESLRQQQLERQLWLRTQKWRRQNPTLWQRQLLHPMPAAVSTMDEMAEADWQPMAATIVVAVAVTVVAAVD